VNLAHRLSGEESFFAGSGTAFAPWGGGAISYFF
jgi:hypothetical protein